MCTEWGGRPFYHCSGLRRISLLINPGRDPDVPVTVFALRFSLWITTSKFFHAADHFSKTDILCFSKILATWNNCNLNNFLSNLICLSNWQTWLGMKGCPPRGIFTRLPADFKSFTIHETDLCHPLLPIQTQAKSNMHEVANELDMFSLFTRSKIM